MTATASSIPLAGAHLCRARHVCAFFHSADEQYDVTMPFVREGLFAGQKAVHIVNPAMRDEHLRRMQSGGVDAAAAQRDGQFELHDWSDTFFAEGDFNAERMLATLGGVLQAGRQQGYSLTRFVAHAEWALDSRAGLDQLLEFEARVNTIWPEDSDAVICCYDLNRFQGDVVIEALRTHPMVIIGGILQENPFFVRPDQFLRELHAR